MKKVLSFVFCSTIILLLSSSAVLAQEWSKQQTEVWSVVVKSWSAWQSGNTTAVMALIHDDYQGWSADQPIPFGKNQVSSIYEWRAANSKVQHHTLNIARILVEKNVAVVHYYFVFSSQFTEDDETESKTMSGKKTETYIKNGGKWLLIGDMTIYDEDDEEDDDD